MERLLDLGARRLGLDPAEIRRRNLIRPAEMPYRPGLTYKDGVPIPYDPGDFPAAFERALDPARLRGVARAPGRAADGPRRIGIGLGCYLQGTGLGPYEGATVRVDPSGKVYVYIGVAAQGQGHATTLAQIAADGARRARFDDVQRGGRRHRTVPVRHGHGRQPRDRQRRSRGGAHRARGARAGRAGGRRAAGVRARGRAHRGRRGLRGRRCPTRSVPLGRLAQAAVQGRRRSSATRRARAQRLHVLLPGHRDVGVRHARGRGRGRRGDVRGPLLALRRRARSRAAPSIP